jgi:hypothetical protein
MSCGASTFTFDLGSEDADRGQDDQRGIDLLRPVWHMLDLTLQGRDDWYAELSYEPWRIPPRTGASGGSSAPPGSRVVGLRTHILPAG